MIGAALGDAEAPRTSSAITNARIAVTVVTRARRSVHFEPGVARCVKEVIVQSLCRRQTSWENETAVGVRAALREADCEQAVRPRQGHPSRRQAIWTELPGASRHSVMRWQVDRAYRGVACWTVGVLGRGWSA